MLCSKNRNQGSRPVVMYVNVLILSQAQITAALSRDDIPMLCERDAWLRSQVLTDSSFWMIEALDRPMGDWACRMAKDVELVDSKHAGDCFP